MRRPILLVALALALASPAGCTLEPGSSGASGSSPRDFPVEPGGKTDVFGRSLAGVAAPYEHDATLRDREDELRTDMGERRRVAWEIVGRVADPVPLLGYADVADAHEEVELPDGEMPRVPRWQTWYGVDDFKRMFQHLYEALGAEGRVRREPFGEEELALAEQHNARAAERSERWPLERYLRYVAALGECPEDVDPAECARSRQSDFSGSTGGNARITYSPATVRHLLRSYPDILRCLEELDGLSMDEVPREESFAFCFDREMPADAVLVKAQWARADFGMQVPAYDTDAVTLGRVVGPETSGDWGDGDRRVDPDPDRIVTIRLRNGSTYRLTGLHVMTKETRHWMWITLWWSDRPDEDFGADRPAWVREVLGEAWASYKMCVVSAYEEGDADPAGHFGDQPSLAAALAATGAPGPTWCSNPYIEHGRGNARTNCIGCHQHGGSTVGRDLDGDGVLDPLDLDAVITDEERFPDNGRRQIRDVFPGDYLWSLVRVDDIAGVIRREAQHFDHVDEDTVPARAARVLDLEGDAAEGELLFDAHCARCHGEDGTGTGRAPSLYERVPSRDGFALVETLIAGRGAMPAWGDTFDDPQLAHLLAFLHTTFAE